MSEPTCIHPFCRVPEFAVCPAGIWARGHCIMLECPHHQGEEPAQDHSRILIEAADVPATELEAATRRLNASRQPIFEAMEMIQPLFSGQAATAQQFYEAWTSMMVASARAGFAVQQALLDVNQKAMRPPLAAEPDAIVRAYSNLMRSLMGLPPIASEAESKAAAE